jgi:V/A-type H+/Na+-transporting ATPase subunit D
MIQRFQYNKTALQTIRRNLQIRQKALPILRNKENALRQEARETGYELERKEEELNRQQELMLPYARHWVAVPGVLRLEKAEYHERNVVGVRIPVLESVRFTTAPYSASQEVAWLPVALEKLKVLIRLQLEVDVLRQQLARLQVARKKTTQKVNLYEKVQIPAYREAIIKIKRFLEDKNNIAKAAHKIMKNKTAGV